ncbi:hypothetical protein ACI797_19145 [Geodermatophilus sp. SYSU D00691]
MGSAAGVSSWDVHIGHLPPHRWDELDQLGEHARRVVGGHEQRPPITSETISWESLELTPRWIGEDSSGAIAAIEPGLFANRGAEEWHRFTAGAAKRGEVALALSMIGTPEEPQVISPFGPSASISLPAAAMSLISVGGPRLALAVAPAPAEDLGPADRDLALRLGSIRDPSLPWWSLHLRGNEVHYGGRAASQIVSPTGSLRPLLVSAAGEIVAAVWTSPDQTVRHYIIPWLPAWIPVLDWLAKRAIPEFIPSASRRLHARIGDEPDLQTVAEASAHAALIQLDEEYKARRGELENDLREARASADALRHDLLFGSGKQLEAAVSRALADAGISVSSLDEVLGRPASADLLVAYANRVRMIEVKSAGGNPSERLVDSAKKHLATWPALRPDIVVDGILLVINHQTSTHPLDRSTSAYSRSEFVRTLSIPVLTTLDLFHAWRQGDYDAIRNAIFSEDPPLGDTPDGEPITPATQSVDRTPRWWRRHR